VEFGNPTIIRIGVFAFRGQFRTCRERSIEMSKINWSIAAVLVCAVVLMSLAGEAQAKRDYEFSCGRGGCHTEDRNAFTVINNDDTIDQGLGELKVFDVEPGDNVSLTADVFNMNPGGKYAVAIDNLDALPLSSSAGWESQGSYHTTNNRYDYNNDWTYQLAVDAEADEGYYLFQFNVAGKGGPRWFDSEQFYVNVIIALPTMGDTNGNDIVDDTDYDNLVAQFGGPPGANSADFNNDGVVDLIDFSLQRENFGFGVLSAAPEMGSLAAVPEPATLSLLALGAMAMLKRRRRRT